MNQLKKVQELARAYYKSDDPSHDWIHIQRVAATCKELGEKSGARLHLLLAACYLHDLVNIPKNHPDRSKASLQSAELAKKILKDCDYDSNEIEIIKKIIEEHSYSRKEKPSTLEAALLQDADRLDAIGAIGILRCASISTQMKSQFYHEQDIKAEQRPLDDKAFMIDHYFTKLFNLPDTMNTDVATIEAHRRVDFMKRFLEELIREVHPHE